MALILSIETSASNCSVAIHSDGTSVDTIEIFEPQSHAARCASSIDQILAKNGLEIEKFEAVAISSGPGSYTGLRIGASVAKGICFGLNIPLIEIPTLNLLAHHISTMGHGYFLCPMIDARRMEVYTQVFDPELNAKSITEAVVVDENSFVELLATHKVLFFGDGAAKCKEVLAHPNALFVDGVYPRANMMGALAEKKFKTNEFADLVEFTPFYLKEFVAKIAQRNF